MSITSISALLGGSIIDTPPDNGGLPIQERGVVYSTTASTDADLRIGKPGVTVVEAPAGAPSGVFMVTAGPLKPDTTYHFRAFATNGVLDPAQFETGYTNVVTFKTNPGSAQSNRILMPAETVTHNGPTDYANLNKVLFFQPTKGQTWKDSTGKQFQIPQIPEKQITFTNNLTQTVYPFMRDAAATADPRAKGQTPPFYQGFYDPFDQLNEEYRGYIGYQSNGVNYLGLPPGMSITINVPLAFWDGARCEIAADGTYLINDLKVVVNPEPANAVPNPFQYYARNTDGSPTARVALPAVSVAGAPPGVTRGMVMWYRAGLNTQTVNGVVDRTIVPIEQANAPAGDAPSQLIEWTIRDTVLSTINPNIDKEKPNFGETHANINYDVSYVDNMALPVAMEALDVPVPVQTTPALDPRNPNPGPRLPFGWIGAALPLSDFQAAVNNILSSGLGDYFGGSPWPQYYLPASRFPGGAPVKIPSGQSVLSDSPLVDHRTSYDGNDVNHYMLTSGGTDAIQVGDSAWSRGTTLYLLANTFTLQEVLKGKLKVGMDVTGSNIPSGTTVKVQSIDHDTSGNFVFSDFQPGDGSTVKALKVTVDNSVADSGATSFSYTFRRPTADYATTALIKLWYTWANYYVTHLPSDAMDQPGLTGKTIPDPDPKNKNNINNVILLDNPNTHLVPGMLVTGRTGLLPGATTIESIDPDHRTIHLSQAVSLNVTGAWDFTLPTMTGPAMAGFDPANLLPDFAPADNQVSGVPNALQFAQYAYQLLSLMSQVPLENTNPVDILHNVIGGNITKNGLNGDANHNTERAYRDKIKSLLRGVNDFTVQNDQANQWYPDPTLKIGWDANADPKKTFNIYNLDPFVWLVHKQMGLSGYGFSLDDDAADISGNFSTKLGVAIGGLNGLPNHFEWIDGAPYGPVSVEATVLAAKYPETPPPPPVDVNEIAKLPPYSFFSVRPYLD
jgi:hypothetical protein